MKYFSIFLTILFLCSCGSGGGSSSETNTQSNRGYKEMTAEDINPKLSTDAYSVDFREFHRDGFNNDGSKIADINIVMIDRSPGGDLYLAYDAMIYSYSTALFDSTTWSGSTTFTLFIDNDNNTSTGESIRDIGADIKLKSLGQYIWDQSTSTWQQTKFETTPPPFRISGTGGISTFQESGSSDIWVQVYKRLRYLDALTISNDARGIIQSEYTYYDMSLGIFTVGPLDTTDSFSLSGL
jgi:hypothetical protein